MKSVNSLLGPAHTARTQIVTEIVNVPASVPVSVRVTRASSSKSAFRSQSLTRTSKPKQKARRSRSCVKKVNNPFIEPIVPIINIPIEPIVPIINMPVEVSNGSTKHFWKSFKPFDGDRNKTVSWLAEFESLALSTGLNDPGKLEHCKHYVTPNVNSLLDSTSPNPADYATWKANFLLNYKLSEMESFGQWQIFSNANLPRANQSVRDYVHSVHIKAKALDIPDHLALMAVKQHIGSTLTCAFTPCDTITAILSNPKAGEITCFAFSAPPPTATPADQEGNARMKAMESMLSSMQISAHQQLQQQRQLAADVCAMNSYRHTSYKEDNPHYQKTDDRPTYQKPADRPRYAKAEDRDRHQTEDYKPRPGFPHKDATGKCNYCADMNCESKFNCKAKGFYCAKCSKQNHNILACKSKKH